MATATQTAPNASVTVTDDQQSNDSNWFSATWNKMPWNGDSQKSTDANADTSSNGDQKSGIDFSFLPWNKSSSAADANATTNGNVDVKEKATSDGTDTDNQGNALTGLWNKMPWNSSSTDSNANANANANASASASVSVSTSNESANNDGQSQNPLSSLWSKITGGSSSDQQAKADDSTAN